MKAATETTCKSWCDTNGYRLLLVIASTLVVTTRCIWPSLRLCVALEGCPQQQLHTTLQSVPAPGEELPDAGSKLCLLILLLSTIGFIMQSNSLIM